MSKNAITTCVIAPAAFMTGRANARTSTRVRVGAVDHDVVDDDHASLLQRAHERHPVLGIRLAVARADAVRLGVAADLDVVASRAGP